MKSFILHLKALKALTLIVGLTLVLAGDLIAQIGYFDAPYVRYEANAGTLASGASVLSKSYNQSDLQSEASDQICVNLSNSGASVNWTVTADGDGLVVRYSVPDGQSALLDVYANNVNVGTLNLTTYYSWEYLSSNGNPNNAGVVNTNPKMRFDEVRMKLPSKILSGGNLKLVRQSGTIYLDFAELEPVPPAVTASGGNVVYGGNGSDLQTVIDNNGGATIYLPPGVYNVNRDLYFGVNNTTLKGAGMWYTQIHFTSGAANDGGLWGQASNISYSGLYLTTSRNSRSNSYKAINGVYTSGSTITNVWAEHFECGAWIAQFGAGPIVADGFVMSNCRFRNNYADGTNLSKGTRNATVEHCSYRNNGDDDMAIWPANNQSCDNNTFRYNTSENCWRASGCAIYGGQSNQAHHLLIKDNLEVGLRVGNNFGGSPFSTSGQHQFYNIRIISCGTYNDLFNSPVGAIDLLVTNVAGTRVNNVKFSCIEIIDSKNDAIYIDKKSGDGFYNLVFENITIDGTGKEYPNNGAGSGNGGARGYGVMFWGYPGGNATYCGMSYANRGGNASSDVNTGQQGSMSWSAAGSCPTGCTLLVSSTTVTSATSFNMCSAPFALTATTTPPSGNTVNYVEFFVDGVSVGSDNTPTTYGVSWTNPTAGTHLVTAVAHYSPSNTTSTSAGQTITVIQSVYQTPSAPTIDGVVEASWNGYPTTSLVYGLNSPPDLAATFRTRYDATNLYVLIDVTDNVVQNDGGNNWDNDGVEIFIDMGNDKNGTYGLNDFQFAFVTGNTTVFEYKHTAITGVTFAQGTKAGGYLMEVRIPWSTLGGIPAVGSLMGFDVGINDDDDNGIRDSQLSGNDPTFTEYNNPSLFGTLQIANCSNPLPVLLMEFTGEKKYESVVLHWSTSAEINNQKFVVERSTNGSDWEAITEIAGAGNSALINRYHFTDYSVSGRIIYYRLQQVDFDGVFEYSEVLVIKTETPHPTLHIVPNPFDQELKIFCEIDGNLEIEIHDMLGKLLYQDHRENNKGEILLQPELASGAYLMTIRTDTWVDQRKLIKK